MPAIYLRNFSQGCVGPSLKLAGEIKGVAQRRHQHSSTVLPHVCGGGATTTSIPFFLPTENTDDSVMYWFSEAKIPSSIKSAIILNGLISAAAANSRTVVGISTLIFRLFESSLELRATISILGKCYDEPPRHGEPSSVGVLCLGANLSDRS